MQNQDDGTSNSRFHSAILAHWLRVRFWVLFMHILVMTAGWHSALACIQSFGRRGHRISVPGLGERSPNSRSRYVHNVIPPSHGALSLEDASDLLIKTTLENKIDLVIPVTDEDAEIAALAQAKTSNTDLFPTGTVEAVRIMRSRNRTTELCAELGISTPATVFTHTDTLMSDAEKRGYPFFLKQSGSVASRGVARIDNEKVLRTVARDIRPGTEIQMQEVVNGDFVGLTAFCRAGEVVKNFAFQTPYELSFRGNPPFATAKTVTPQLLDCMRKIAGRLNWSGGIDLDFLQGGDGKTYLLEINPRLSGTIVFAQKIGLDFPSAYLNVDDEVFIPGLNRGADGFICLLTESGYLRQDFPRWSDYAIKFRSEHMCVESAYPDDPGFSGAMHAEYMNNIRVGCENSGRRKRSGVLRSILKPKRRNRPS
ncbi:ATP-grasp domain-containing protein [Hoeflea sp. CAU 1731]